MPCCIVVRDPVHRESCELGISSEVVFLPSINSEEKRDLLARCLCVLYTPEDEHFGIVPLEAMAAGKPVLACNSGGPMESIVDGVTGFLCAPVPEVFSFPCLVGEGGYVPRNINALTFFPFQRLIKHRSLGLLCRKSVTILA